LVATWSTFAPQNVIGSNDAVPTVRVASTRYRVPVEVVAVQAARSSDKPMTVRIITARVIESRLPLLPSGFTPRTHATDASASSNQVTVVMREPEAVDMTQARAAPADASAGDAALDVGISTEENTTPQSKEIFRHAVNETGDTLEG